MSETTIPEARLLAAGHPLPPPPPPRGRYASWCTTPIGAGRSWVHVSGQVCRVDGKARVGQCRLEGHVAEAARSAEVAACNALAVLAAAAGGLENVEQVVRMRGYVNSHADFAWHGAVIDGASAVIATAFPGQPPPARTAVGVCSLPDGAWVELEVEAIIRRRLPGSGKRRPLTV